MPNLTGTVALEETLSGAVKGQPGGKVLYKQCSKASNLRSVQGLWVLEILKAKGR